MHDWKSRAVRSALPALAAIAALLSIAPAAQAATLTVHCDSGGNLQNKINAAPSGSTILIDGTCRGNFVVLGKSLTLKGNPAATLDGMDAGSTIFTDSTLHLAHLTVTGGLFSNGAGVDSSAPGPVTLTLHKVTVTGNEAIGQSGVRGGGVFTSGDLTVTSSTITDNRVTAVSSPHSASGGGLYSSGNMTVTGSVISGNDAAVVADGTLPSGAASGAGLTVHGSLTIADTKLTGNAVASKGDQADAEASAINVNAFGAASVTNVLVTGNTANASSSSGGDTVFAGPAVYAGTSATVAGSTVAQNISSARADTADVEVDSAGIEGNGPLTVRKSVVEGNTASGSGQNANLFGAAVYNLDSSAKLRVVRSRVSDNSGKASGGAGNAEALGGIFSAGSLGLSRSTVDRNRLTANATGGFAEAEAPGATAQAVASTASTVSRNAATATAAGSNQAIAQGGGIDAGQATLKNSTVAGNHIAGNTGSGAATVSGGGLRIGTAASSLVDDTVARNTISGTGGVLVLQGGGLWGSSSTTLRATIIGLNSAPTGPDCYGGPVSGGRNLIGDDAGCSFTHLSTDKVNKNPRLDPLAANGGPTETILLKPTSPALNAVPTAVCPIPTDQRGVHRPQGPKCDIGAVEDKPGEG
jgi:fibronectin-binding autotransporter adhesin